jgi:predicted glycoside hydrolase/deacetylase ChbG (UPF0249 family)
MIEFPESHRKRLIVSADDFGVNSRSNRNILYLVSLGKIDRVGVMVNGTMSPKEIDELVRSGVKLDIHLDIFKEFRKNRRKGSGAAVRVAEFLFLYLTGRISKKMVGRDWQIQIKKFKKLFGKNPDGINSHEHVHFFPPLFKIALGLEVEYSVPFIRFGDSISLRHHSVVSHILHWLRKINMRACLEANCVSSGSLVSLDWIEDVDAFIDNLPDGTIEIVTHPEKAEDFVKIKKYF